MNTNIRILLIFLVVFGIAGSVVALTKEDIVFPVAELGNCQNEQECRAYCDDPENITQCIVFAEQYNLLSEKELEKAKKFQDVGEGPGGCTNESECEEYCEDISNIEECLVFAQEHGFMDEDELGEARKVAQALRQGAQLPGGCTSKSDCETYCGDPDNMRECIEFAEAAGFIPPEELKEAKQMLKALEAGIRPPNCRGKAQCDIYCGEPTHMEECVEFGIAAGFIPPEEVEQVRRILPLMKSGKMPKECQKGKERCEAYCAQDENIEECTTFFTEAGFMTQEEAQMFRKTKGKGPGDCKGKEECEAFCNDSANQETCFAFGKEHGLISEEDLRNIEEGTRQMKEGIETAPPEVAGCLQQRIGTEVLQKIEAGTLMPNPQLGETMRSCFEEFMPRPQEGSFEGGEQGFPSGQAGCVERILGDSRERSGPPTQEQEQRLREECFGQANQQFPSPQQFEGERMQGEFEQEFQREFQEGFKQEFQEEFERQRQQQIQQIPQDDSRAASCVGEGGVWDGSACRPAGQSGEFFSETGPSQDQQVIQQTQEQIQRQIQQQQLEQQIQEQQRQLQEQLQLLEQQTSPPSPTSTGGNILDAAGALLKQFLRR